jgi:hydrogenase expression/formation protein HypC
MSSEITLPTPSANEFAAVGRRPIAPVSSGEARSGDFNRRSCAIDAGEHCLTCSDEALPARVLSVDETGLALVALDDATTVEVDVTLVDAVAPGAWVLVHGGVAIGTLDEASHE